MPRSRFHKWLLKLMSLLRVFIMAWMVGIANSIKQEGRFMEDTFIKTEIVEEQEDDDPLE